tara:strand:+ start:189 stop:392 length:204 start_codon:yes stop_codon:yes gene_type:complete
MDKVNLQEIIRQIQAWHTEAVSGRNDGWTQQAYKDRLETLHARVSAVMESIRPSGQEALQENKEEKE